MYLKNVNTLIVLLLRLALQRGFINTYYMDSFYEQLNFKEYKKGQTKIITYIQKLIRREEIVERLGSNLQRF